MLVFPDFSQEFVLETGASGKGVGAILAQKQLDGSIRPIAYASRHSNNLKESTVQLN